MISVAEALAHIFDLVAPLPTEEVALEDAAGRVLAAPVIARRDQPPFAASAMDGYAVTAADARPGASLGVIGTSAAGHGFDGTLAPGQAVRIFTGAPVPPGADRVIIQEDVMRDGDRITLGDRLDSAAHIRPAGADFACGDTLSAPRRLRPADLALAAAMNVPRVTAHRRPRVAIIATGDELVMPGETPGPDQIIAANGFALTAMAEAEGARAQMLPIARDTEASLRAVFAQARDADLILTIGGASVGDHDLVGKVAADLGLNQSFYKVAMRPGKPLMAGRLGDATMIGLPGNPVSALVCAHVFVLPAIRVMQGLPAEPAPASRAPVACDLPANGPRAHYMRARIIDGRLVPFDSQDSALLTILSEARALIVRAPHEGPRQAGERVDYLPL
ncbi:molybdopterin molybdotransferase MoeA [Rhodovulum adriaticum]|uniref:Molybdopterin molybdenumtransferase n=1 Tax=Rhodovulum adriaticum TaxID=35804 RepID=A0A4R2NU22_RHOAD|nr:gephyrin-like molybdotransferase Glp [Rhodovulum adriaticum]MBK1635930.1 molybdopterin molybdenumtransferase MoeA [Rhodovulum adriaticum]TCP25387.1 molybdopterin molybdotransferase [Rhodovulum adriaticum]